MAIQDTQRMILSSETIYACASIVAEFTAWVDSVVRSSTDPITELALVRAQIELISIVHKVSGV